MAFKKFLEIKKINLDPNDLDVGNNKVVVSSETEAKNKWSSEKSNYDLSKFRAFYHICRHGKKNQSCKIKEI